MGVEKRKRRGYERNGSVRQGQSRFRVHVSTVVVVVVGLAAALVGFAAASSSVRENDNALLKQSAAQGGVVLSAYLTQLQAPLSKLASEIPASGAFPGDFTSVLSAVAKSADGESVALLRVVGDHLEVVASTGPIHRSFGGSADAGLIKRLGSTNVQYTQIVPADHLRWLGQLSGPNVAGLGLPAGYLYR